MKLSGKIILITGASSGIGREAAIEFARRGARVVATARRSGRLRALARRIASAGGECVPIAADITRRADVLRLFNAVRALFGRVDILLNNAGRGAKGPFERITEAEFARTMALNVTAVFRCTREALKMMPRGGRIMTVSSVAGLYGGPGYSAYCASKHAVTGMMRSLKLEKLGTGIDVSVIHPARVDTEFFRRYPRRPARWQMLSARDVARHLAVIASGSVLSRALFRAVLILKRVWYAIRYCPPFT